MKLKCQLYIDNSDDVIGVEERYELVDFFQFETIELTSAIKTIQEVDKVFTDYTKEFVVPASKTNNKLFKHFYSTKIQGGFDARVKRKARIFLNGFFFKQGYIRLQSSQVKNGYVYSYTLNFFGALSGLEDVIGEDELTVLSDLQKYNHDYDVDTVFDGLTSGLQLKGEKTDIYGFSVGTMEAYGTAGRNISRDVVYPMISAENKWYYDSGGTTADSTFNQGLSVNLYNDNGAGSPDNNYGIHYTSLKPAIKVAHIIDAISEQYESINFKEDSFVYSNELNDLYILLHNTHSILATSKGDFDEDSVRLDVLGDRSFSFNTGEDLRPIITYSRVEQGWNTQVAQNRTEMTLNITVNAPVSDIQFFVDLYDDTNVIDTREFTSSSVSMTTNITSKSYKEWSNLYYVIRSTGGLTDFDTDLELTEYYETIKGIENIRKWQSQWDDPTITWDSNTKTGTYLGRAGYNFLTRIDILKHLPKMKIIDFLKGLFQMFNLVADVDRDTGEIDIIPLKDYYNNGVDRDITNYIDTFNYDVDRVQLYGKFDFKYQEPKTFGLINHNDLNQDKFGDLEFDATQNGGQFNLVFDNQKYEVNAPFEKLYYTRLPDEDSSVTNQNRNTTICSSWLADKDQSPVLTKPILFYNTNQAVDTATYKFGMRGVSTPAFISTYNRAGNSNSDESYSLNFGSEIDEFSFNLVENSLFELYYKSFIENVFTEDARNVKFEARLPLSLLFSYSLADRFIIEGTPFRINEITTNLNTGKSQLDLITDFEIIEEVVADVTPPSQVTGVIRQSSFTRGLEIRWEEATDNVAVTGYNIYVDSVLYKTVGVTNIARIRDLSPSTSYDIQVSALDAAGNEGTLSAVVAMSTGALSDVTPPSTPQNVVTTLLGSTAITIEWDESRDDTAVTDYRVFVGGVFNQTVLAPTTTATIGSLTANTDYEIEVTARDAAGNESFKSTSITVRTLIT